MLDRVFTPEEFVGLCLEVEKEHPGVVFHATVHLTRNWTTRNKDNTGKIVVYICFDLNSGRVLKVGESLNWRGRFNSGGYGYRDRSMDVLVAMYEAKDWDYMDFVEIQIRKYLEQKKGCHLPWDNTSERLRRMKRPDLSRIDGKFIEFDVQQAA